MKRMLQGLFFCAAFCAATIHAAAPYFAFRSQSVNAVRELVGEQTLINRADMDTFYSVFAITPEFTRTFWPGKLANCIFGADATCNDCKATINVIGSLNSDGTINTNRGRAWLADYFGLSRDYSGTLCFEPRIWNFNIDFNYYLGLDEWAKGMYFRIHAPLTYSKWNLGFCEACGCDDTTATYGYDAGYFAPDAVEAANLYAKASDFFTGNPATPDLGRNATDSANIIFEPLQYSKFSTCCDGNGICRLSDIEMALGWNFILHEDCHVGVELRTSLPTGNKPRADYIFMPVIGQGGQWKLGAGLTAHSVIRRWCDDEKSLSFWLTAYVQHLFDACQERVFDLHCKPNSRYMIAAQLRNPTPSDTLRGGPIALTADASEYIFADHYAPVANLTHRCVKVSVPVEGDVVAKFAYNRGNFEWDLGYEFWGRSCEQICKKESCTDRIANEMWVLKGDAYEYGSYGSAPTPTPLAASEHNATIYSGTNFNCTTTTGWYNPNIDFAELAWAGSLPIVYDGDDLGFQTRTSIQAVLLKDSDIGYEDAQTKSYSNKIFTHFNYIWRDDACRVLPFLGIGGSAEFAPSCCENNCKTCDNNCCNTNNCGTTTCTSSSNVSCLGCQEVTNCAGCCETCCQRCGLSQWAVWVKGGFTW